MNQSSVTPEAADFTNIAGPSVLGHLLSCALFGVLAVQLYVYTIAFKHDPRWLRVLVYTIFTLEVAFQGIEAYSAWYSLGAGWGKVANLKGYPLPTVAFSTLTGVITSLVHGFYSWRIAVLMRKYVVVVIIGLLSLVQLSMSIYVTVHVARAQGQAALAALHQTSKIITVWFSFSAAADVLITVAMTMLLLAARRRSHYVFTNTRLQNLIKYTVETGLITSCSVLIVLALFLALPEDRYHYILYYSLGKIYANTLMATLNARITFVTSGQVANSDTALMLRGQTNENDHLWTDLQHKSSASAPQKRGREDDLQVSVAKSTLVLRDDEDIEMSGKSSRQTRLTGDGSVSSHTLDANNRL
ncbi:hypothetical protein BDV98DRAFT_568664 [Pterulicium gracile]|uniref:DUF6534 domain-containing protein n=1 Tax=Pterulicium gracile TaxID=1884261 RepID=A0A5C3QHZ6_9AGAR|nr:hypothetical protein BDV98DRAFT_568664 [Pterula gracilis]